MDLSDDEQLVHVPDYDPNASFDGIFFDTDSSSNNSMTTLSTGEAAGRAGGLGPATSHDTGGA
ncbi:hypothetical protein FRC08_009635 [Ceratobasidium sp. 394]|nr:hypothetical protein FRC08_009635 [Ceratobasidium sp. 394]